MRDNKSLEIIFIIDKSGSMAGQASDVITGYNAVLCKYRAMKLPIRFTTAFFSYDVVFSGVGTPIEMMSPLKPTDYCPGGGTALYDAIGKTINQVLDSRRDVADDGLTQETLCFITTDGMENSSHFFTNDQIRELIDVQTKNGWKFYYLGAGIDAFEGAYDVGLPSSSAHSFSSAMECLSFAECCLADFLGVPDDSLDAPDDIDTKVEPKH